MSYLYFPNLSSHAQNGTAALLPPGILQLLDNNGNPLTSGTITTYAAGTSTLKTTWKDSAESIPNTNPIKLDAGGKAIVYGEGTYRFVVKDRNGNVIWDAVTTAAGTGGSTPTNVGDGNAVGTVLPWSALVPPAQYVFAYGQEISRTVYPDFYTAITLQTNVVCSSSSNTLTGISDTSQIPVGGAVELSLCVLPGTTVVSKTSSTVTLSNPSTVSINAVATFFPWGNGNGTNTFNVPDFRGYVMAGRDNMGGGAAGRLTTTYFGNGTTSTPDALGGIGGSQSHTMTISELVMHNHGVVIHDPGHQHSETYNNGGTGSGITGNSNSTGNVATTNLTSIVTTGITAETLNTGGISPFSIVQPTVTINYIVKVTKDVPISTTSVVTSISGMTGALSCGLGIICQNQTISSNPSGIADTIIKTPVIAATISASTLFGLSAIDGVTINNGDRILVKDNNDITNGIYNANSSNWTRSTDFDNNGEVITGTQILVTGGNTNNGNTFIVTNSNPIIIGTTIIKFDSIPRNVNFGNNTNPITPDLTFGYVGTKIIATTNGNMVTAATVGALHVESNRSSGQGGIANGLESICSNSGSYVPTILDGGCVAAFFRTIDTTGATQFGINCTQNNSTTTGGIYRCAEFDRSFTAAPQDYAGLIFNTTVFNTALISNTETIRGSGTTFKTDTVLQAISTGGKAYANFLNTSQNTGSTGQAISDNLWLHGGNQTVTAGSFITGVQYTIQSIGTTNFTLIGAASNTIGLLFTATGPGSGSGTAGNYIVNTGLEWSNGVFFKYVFHLPNNFNIYQDGSFAVGLDADVGGGGGIVSSYLQIGAAGAASTGLILGGSGSGTLTVKGPATATGTLTFPSGTTDFSTTGGTSRVVKQTSVGAAFTVAQLACSDLSGVGTGCSSAAGITALTGDVTASGSGSVAATLATVNSNVGTFGSATQVPQITVNGKGLTTALTNVTITPAIGSITGLGTGVATALGVNTGTAGSFVVNGGALGTPSSGTVTNLTGTASININGTVGATTATTGAFTTLTANGIISATSAGSASNPEITVGNSTTGIYSVSTTGFGISVNGSLKADYGITQSGSFNITSGEERITDGSSAQIRLLANGGSNFIQSINSAGNASVQLNITGLNSTAMPILSVVATSTILSGTLTATLANTATTSAICYNTGTGLFTYDGTLGTCTVSDERYKNIEGHLNNSLNKIASLNGYYFNWKDPAMGEGRQIGAIAQEVEKVFPELVSTDSTGKKSTSMTGAFAPFIEAIKELKVDNDNLRACNDNWKCRLFGWK